MDPASVFTGFSVIASFTAVYLLSKEGQSYLASKSDDKTLPICAMLLAFTFGPVIASYIAGAILGPEVAALSFASGLLGGAWGVIEGTGAFAALTNWLRRSD